MNDFKINRIPQLDYMRAIAMMMVVMGHILLFVIGVDKSLLLGLFGICELPIFFVVSGFLSCKSLATSSCITFRTDLKCIAKYSRTLLIPMAVWSVIANVCFGEIDISLSMVYRGGYWFFFVLWWCNVINIILSHVSQVKRFSMLKEIVLYGVGYIVILVCRLQHITLGGFLPIQNIQYFFPMFVLGVLMRKYECIYRLILNKYLYATGLLTVAVGWYFHEIPSFIIWFIAAIGSVIVIWTVCMNLNPNSKLGRALLVVGRNTLPIYAIHYLFLAPFPPSFQEFFNGGTLFIFQFVTALTYAVIVVALCLVIDRIISLNSITRMIFWGEIKRRDLKLR